MINPKHFSYTLGTCDAADPVECGCRVCQAGIWKRQKEASDASRVLRPRAARPTSPPTLTLIDCSPRTASTPALAPVGRAPVGCGDPDPYECGCTQCRAHLRQSRR